MSNQKYLTRLFKIKNIDLLNKELVPSFEYLKIAKKILVDLIKVAISDHNYPEKIYAVWESNIAAKKIKKNDAVSKIAFFLEHYKTIESKKLLKAISEAFSQVQSAEHNFEKVKAEVSEKLNITFFMKAGKLKQYVNIPVSILPPKKFVERHPDFKRTIPTKMFKVEESTNDNIKQLLDELIDNGTIILKINITHPKEILFSEIKRIIITAKRITKTDKFRQESQLEKEIFEAEFMRQYPGCKDLKSAIDETWKILTAKKVNLPDNDSIRRKFIPEILKKYNLKTARELKALAASLMVKSGPEPSV